MVLLCNEFLGSERKTALQIVFIGKTGYTYHRENVTLHTDCGAAWILDDKDGSP